ncbi:MAG: hypothetical protein ACXV5H_04895 [Halobacteriota archaeon]
MRGRNAHIGKDGSGSEPDMRQLIKATTRGDATGDVTAQISGLGPDNGWPLTATLC